MRTQTVNQINPAYTHYLERDFKKVKKASRTGDKEHLISVITNIIEPSAESYVGKNGQTLPTKKVKFLKTINSSRMSVEKIMLYCNNSINKARRTEAKYNNL